MVDHGNQVEVRHHQHGRNTAGGHQFLHVGRRVVAPDVNELPEEVEHHEGVDRLIYLGDDEISHELCGAHKSRISESRWPARFKRPVGHLGYKRIADGRLAEKFAHVLACVGGLVEHLQYPLELRAEALQRGSPLVGDAVQLLDGASRASLAHVMDSLGTFSLLL